MSLSVSNAHGPRSTGYDPRIHHRRSIRMRGHDYAGGGGYFITLCVADRRPLFGTVVNGRMSLNATGCAAAACWREIPAHFPMASLDEWIIMPDHVHGIIRIQPDGSVRPGGGPPPPAQFPPGSPRPRPCGTSRTLGSIVRGFKIGVTKFLGGESPWQRDYYDIIIRDARALANIRRYIRENPAQWGALDMQKMARPVFAGNPALLDLPMTAFLASRDAGETSFAPRSGGTGERSFAPSTWPDRPACVVSGFLSPMERAVLDACLADEIPVVWVMARGLPKHFPPRIQRAVDRGLLLAMTSYPEQVEGFSAARATGCNQQALFLATRAVIGALSPDGMLDCLLADLPRDIPIQYLHASPSRLE